MGQSKLDSFDLRLLLILFIIASCHFCNPFEIVPTFMLLSITGIYVRLFSKNLHPFYPAK